MTQATKQIFSNGTAQSGSSSEKTEHRGAEEWCSTPYAVHRMDEEEAEEVAKVLAKPQKATAALRSLFAKKW